MSVGETQGERDYVEGLEQDNDQLRKEKLAMAQRDLDIFKKTGEEIKQLKNQNGYFQSLLGDCAKFERELIITQDTLKQKLEKIWNLQTIDLRLMIASSSGDERIIEISNKISRILGEKE